MPDRERPRVTVRDGTGTAAADLLVSGSDTPDRRRRRGWAVAAAVAVALVLLLPTVQRDAGQAPPAPDLRLVETGGAPKVSWGYGGRLEVSLPVLITNDGGPMTVRSVGLEGSSLVHPALDVALAEGGRLPLTLQRAMTCPEGARVPAEAVVWLNLRRDGRPETRRFPLPDAVTEDVREALRQACRQVPLRQAVMLRSRELEAQGEVVVVLVRVENIGESNLQLRSVNATTGLRVQIATAGASPAASLPLALDDAPVTLALRVSVQDCDRLVPVDRSAPLPVADVGYGDRQGRRAAQAVVGDFPATRELLERSCRAVSSSAGAAQPSSLR